VITTYAQMFGGFVDESRGGELDGGGYGGTRGSTSGGGGSSSNPDNLWVTGGGRGGRSSYSIGGTGRRNPGGWQVGVGGAEQEGGKGGGQEGGQGGGQKPKFRRSSEGSQEARRMSDAGSGVGSGGAGEERKNVTVDEVGDVASVASAGETNFVAIKVPADAHPVPPAPPPPPAPAKKASDAFTILAVFPHAAAAVAFAHAVHVALIYEEWQGLPHIVRHVIETRCQPSCLKSTGIP